MDNPYDPYTNYLIGTFPSGRKSSSSSFNNEIEFYFNQRYTFSILIELKMNNYFSNDKNKRNASVFQLPQVIYFQVHKLYPNNLNFN